MKNLVTYNNFMAALKVVKGNIVNQACHVRLNSAFDPGSGKTGWFIEAGPENYGIAVSCGDVDLKTPGLLLTPMPAVQIGRLYALMQSYGCDMTFEATDCNIRVEPVSKKPMTMFGEPQIPCSRPSVDRTKPNFDITFINLKEIVEQVGSIITENSNMPMFNCLSFEFEPGLMTVFAIDASGHRMAYAKTNKIVTSTCGQLVIPKQPLLRALGGGCFKKLDILSLSQGKNCTIMASILDNNFITSFPETVGTYPPSANWIAKPTNFVIEADLDTFREGLQRIGIMASAEMGFRQTTLSFSHNEIDYDVNSGYGSLAETLPVLANTGMTGNVSFGVDRLLKVLDILKEPIVRMEFENSAYVRLIDTTPAADYTYIVPAVQTL